MATQMKQVIADALAELSQEGLEPSREALVLINQIAEGKLTLDEFVKAEIEKYTALGQGEEISYETALGRIRQ